MHFAHADMHFTYNAKVAKAVDNLDATAANFAGSLAKNVMKGGVKMFQKLHEEDMSFEPCKSFPSNILFSYKILCRLSGTVTWLCYASMHPKPVCRYSAPATCLQLRWLTSQGKLCEAVSG